MRSAVRARVALPAAWAMLALASGQPAAAQGAVGALAAECASVAGLGEPCLHAAHTARALTGGLGLLTDAGGAFPASPSTAGHRLPGSPRIVMDVGAGGASFRVPATSGEGAEERRNLVAARFTVGGGIFEGFSPAATVGGVGSLDGVLSLRLLRLPSGDGFSGSVAAFGVGARIGILRESFSLPGVTLTAMHHRAGTVRHGAADEGGRSVLAPRVTSARLEVGKELLPVGVVGGAGWTRTSSDARITVRSEGAESTAGPRTLRESRRYLFAGLNYTWLVAKLSGEIAWYPRRSPGAAGELEGPYRPGRSALHAALTLRLLY